jgi:aryl-alcohol dehydrogenase-like predicted oxidoreductase
MTETDYIIQDKVQQIAKELVRSLSQIAVNWVIHRPAISSAIIGPLLILQY